MSVAETRPGKPGWGNHKKKDLLAVTSIEPNWTNEEEVAKHLGFAGRRSFREGLFACLGPNNLLAEPGTMPILVFPPQAHDGSSARYLADYFLGEGQHRSRILISILPRGAETSEHAHPFDEEYWILTGRPLSIGGVSIFEPYYQVFPNQRHKLKTTAQPALLVIKMNVGTTPSDQWYIGRVSSNGQQAA